MLGHPRDPLPRIDVRESAKHVVIQFNSTVIADTVNIGFTCLLSFHSVV